MVITFRTVSKIQFPVFILPASNWSEKDGLVTIEGKLVDDKNMPGETLGIRRLQTPFKNLLPLRKSVNDLIGVLKQRKNTFVDSDGNVFIYQKTKFTSLKYYKIRKIEQKTVASVLWLKGVNFPFKVIRPPLPEATWAGVLHLNSLPWLLYEYSEDFKSTTKRKI